jgi:hypothetical protein
VTAGWVMLTANIRISIAADTFFSNTIEESRIIIILFVFKGLKSSTLQFIIAADAAFVCGHAATGSLPRLLIELAAGSCL